MFFERDLRILLVAKVLCGVVYDRSVALSTAALKQLTRYKNYITSINILSKNEILRQFLPCYKLNFYLVTCVLYSCGLT